MEDVVYLIFIGSSLRFDGKISHDNIFVQKFAKTKLSI